MDAGCGFGAPTTTRVPERQLSLEADIQRPREEWQLSPTSSHSQAHLNGNHESDFGHYPAHTSARRPARIATTQRAFMPGREPACAMAIQSA
jgi:hypothetical protein